MKVHIAIKSNAKKVVEQSTSKEAAQKSEEMLLKKKTVSIWNILIFLRLSAPMLVIFSLNSMVLIAITKIYLTPITGFLYDANPQKTIWNNRTLKNHEGVNLTSSLEELAKTFTENVEFDFFISLNIAYSSEEIL